MMRISTLFLAAAVGLTLVAAGPLAARAQTEKTKPLADDTMHATKPKRGKPGWTQGVVTSIDMEGKLLVFKDADGTEMKVQVKGDTAKVKLGTLKVGDAIKVADDPKETKIVKTYKPPASLVYDPNIKKSSPVPPKS